MIELRAGAARAVLLPEAGAAFARLTWAGRAILAPIPDGADPNRGPHGAFLMAPWTNRLDGGRIAVGGVEHRMPVNRAGEDTAIHGFLRDMPWRVAQAEAASAVLECRFDRPPFAGLAALRVRLAEDGLALALTLANAGPVATPMGFGWHPWFPRPAGTRFRCGASIIFDRDARNLPIAPRPTTGLEGADAALLGLDCHLAGWDGLAEIAWPDGAGLALRATGAWARNLHFYAPRDGTTLCAEPVTHAPDAPNRPAAAAHGAMHVLAPGDTLEGALTLGWG